MPDPVDHGQMREEEIRQDALAKHRRRMDAQGAGTDACVNCGEDIPEDRRKAVPKARHCVPCEEKIEKSQRMRKL